MSAVTSPSPWSRSAAQAFTTAEPHDAVPIEPPARAAWPKSLSPISIRTCSGPTPSASAAIWVSTVRAPVPMSAAAIWTVKSPSASSRAVAFEGER